MAEREREFELKFTGSPLDIAALPRSLILSALAGGKGEWERLSTTYYDTPEHLLRKAGYSLRMREEGGGLVQTVKALRPGGAGIERDELETGLARKEDFPASTRDMEIDSLIETASGALGPTARTVTDRWSRLAQFRRSRIEIAVDLGRAESWDENGEAHQAPLAELELELKEGAPEDVFDLGRLIARNAPVRFCAQNKLETALSLPKGGRYRSGKAKKPSALADEPVADLLQRTLGDVAHRLAVLQPAVLEAREAEGVHQTRVALRRLRAVERVFRPYLNSGEIADLSERAKLFARRLAPARDWDVFLGETLPAAFESDRACRGNAKLKAAGEAARAEAWAEVAAVIGGPDFTVFLIDLMEAAVLARWRETARKKLFAPVHKFAPKVLDKALKKTLKTANAIDLDDVPSLHLLRIALKKLRYPVQMFRALYAKDKRRYYMAALAALQEEFGAVNDAVVAQRLANEAASGKGDDAMRAAGFVAGYKAAEAKAAAENIRNAWPDFAELKPFWRD